MAPTPNKTLVFKKIPEGFPVVGEHIAVEDRPIDLDSPPKNGLILEVQQASFDPYLRGRMRGPGGKSYIGPFDIDAPIPNGTISKVLKSDNADFKEGDLVSAATAIAEYAAVYDVKAQNVRKISNPHNLDVGYFLGPLGMPGLTAWSGLHKIGKPKKGETIFISSAAGAVGQIVGQIAKKEGLTVIGSAGSDEKVDFVKQIGFDEAFNYKTEKPLDALHRLAPQGVDIYFENVGGEHLEAVLDVINPHGRIIACGMIESYNAPLEKRYGVRNLVNAVMRQVTIQGFIVGSPGYGDVYFKEHQENLSKWIADGSVKAKLDTTEGIDNAASGLVGIFKGENFGKAVLRIR
ncbi:prostaglandin reductase 3 [Geosmithia morbida]|uniref:Dehydrogenase FUB6 n=1 Tax=Geosmithia morbida TaxID=1094350 RepID=A0A9P4Z2W1_9HYPO|nr:prostaglandin reductase 3 [Geosmithia morbida]KAF4126429.1 prostaglandin reductase 3 [Geosmithia morbida]